ncbi:hypothetical protein [Burkholderia pyrrocinia]|uniref:hypothetical protein n=1 Tax=Burkholderia pyrrocinia TaxID=60550 RepID=UPI002AB055A6|nr:hypothetical protein [Burkholderia pyrrocinia]
MNWCRSTADACSRHHRLVPTAADFRRGLPSIISARQNGCANIERRLIGVVHSGYASAGDGMRRMPGRAFLP